MVAQEAGPAEDGETASAIDRLAEAALVQLGTAALYERALAAGEGRLTATGPLVVETGEHTGRSPSDKFVVEDDESRDTVWWGSVNQPVARAHTRDSSSTSSPTSRLDDAMSSTFTPAPTTATACQFD